jgi:heme exporter protein B
MRAGAWPVNTARAILTVVLKDLRGELRTKEALTSTVVFALLVLLVFNFGFEPGTRDVTLVGAGILWSALLFAAVLAMNRLLLNEREGGGLEGLMLTPLSRADIYVAKCMTLFCVLSVAAVITVLLFVLFYNVNLGGQLPTLLAVVFGGVLGLAALGTTFATIAVRTRTREVMLPVLLIPLAVPLLIACVESTAAIIAARDLGEEAHWLRLLLAFDVVFLALGYLTYPAILEE